MEALTTTQVLDKLKALQLRLDTTRGNSQAEADAAASAIASLMFQHNISPEQLRAHTRTDKHAIEYAKAEYDLTANSAWRRSLLRVVCDNFYCKIIVTPVGRHNNHGVAIVGPKDNIDIAIYLYEYLQRTFVGMADDAFKAAQPKKRRMTPERLAKIIKNAGFDIDLSDLHDKRVTADMRDYGAQIEHGKSWKNSFYSGAVNAIEARLRAQRKQDIEETYQQLRLQAPEEETEQQSMGLIVLKEDEIKRGTEAKYKIYFPKVKTMAKSKSRFVGSGWTEGHKAGTSVPLRQGLKGAEEPKLIEAGA